MCLAACIDRKLECFCHLYNTPAVAIAVFAITAALPFPCSQACEGHPIPASTMIGKSISSIRILINSFVQSPLFVPIGAGKWHNSCSSGILKISCYIEIRIHIWHNDKTFLCKNFCRFYRFCVIRQKIFAVTLNFNLYQNFHNDFSGKLCDTDCFICIPGSRCIW